MILIDSTVIVGFLDADDALHEAVRARLKRLGPTRLLAASVISYAEVLAGAALGHHDGGRVQRFFDAVIAELLPVDRAVAACAARLRGRNAALRLPDALILATAEEFVRSGRQRP